MEKLDKTWHLAQTEDEIKVTEFELELWRVFYGFLRWQEECERYVNGMDLTGNELAVLHVVRMKDRPKTITDIGRLLNRDDTFNIQYSIRKLIKRELIKKVKSPDSKKMVAYQVTELGIKDTDAYTQARRSILIDMFAKNSDINLEEVPKTLTKLKMLYGEAAHSAASYITPSSHGKKKKNKQEST